MFGFFTSFTCSYLLPLFSRLQVYKDMTSTPSKIQIRSEFGSFVTPSCLHIILNCLVADNSDSFGLLSAIFVAMGQSDDRLLPRNATLLKLITLSTQLLHKRLQTQKTVDVSYTEVVRLPSQYYTRRHGTPPSTPTKRLTPTPDITPEKPSSKRKSPTADVTPEKPSSKRLSLSTRGRSVEGDTPVALRNMSPITDKEKRDIVELCVCSTLHNPISLGTSIQTPFTTITLLITSLKNKHPKLQALL